MGFVAWVKTREKWIAPALLGTAALLWTAAVAWQLLAAGVPLWSLDALREVYAFGLGGKSGQPPQETLLAAAALLGKGGAALAAVYAYLRVVDVSLDRVGVRLFYRDHVIVVGLGEKARRLALNLRTSGRRVVVVERDDLHPMAPTLRAAGIAVVHGDGRAETVLREAALGRAAALVCLTEQDAVNLQVGRAAREWLARAPAREPLRCVVHVGDRSLRQIASEAPPYRRRDARFDGRVLDVVDIAARGLLTAWAPDALAPLHGADAPAPHVLVVGAEALARAVVVNLALQAHYAAGRKTVVTLFDPAAGLALARLLGEYPSITALLELRTAEVSVQHLAPAQLAEQLGLSGPGGVLPSPVVAYVTLERDIEAMAAGLHLARLARGWDTPPQVVVCVPPETSVMAAIGLDPSGTALGFSTFDRYSICSASYFIGEALDAEARARHERYLAQRLAQGQTNGDRPTRLPWHELDEMVKASNRRQVEHEPVKRRALAALGTGDDALERLAAMEHRRWMADLLMAGWSHGVRYDWDLRRHPDLVAYEDLGEATRDYDRAVIRQLVSGSDVSTAAP
jgi:voltage-gated potassium channel Kch